MSISYQVVPRKVITGADQGKTKYYGQVRAGKRITYARLCKQIALQSSATRGDVKLIMDNFVDMLLIYLDAGNIIQVGELGSFRMSAGSRGADSAEEFNTSYMKKGKVLFYPAVEIKELEKNLKFEQFKPVIKEGEKDEEPNPFPQ